MGSSTHPLLELQTVSLVYPGHANGPAALSEVSLIVPNGATVAIVGTSGAGKSTLALVAAGLLQPTAGEVRHFGRILHGVAVGPPSPVQMVFQNPYSALNPRRTIRSWLELILARRGLRATEHLGEYLALAGFPKARLDVLPGQLSGGECQRACIAASLAADGRVLILDEPVTMLDSIARQTIIRTLKNLRHTRSITYLLITHDLALAADLCQWVHVMEEGRVVESGPVWSVFAKPVADLTRRLLSASFERNDLSPNP